MRFEKLYHTEKQIVLACIRAVADGPFIESDWELHSRVGVHRPTLYKIIKMWNRMDDAVNVADTDRIIHRTLNEVCNGIRFSHADWDRWFNVDKDTIQALFDKWKCLSANHQSNENNN
jgi:hypothetical protein